MKSSSLRSLTRAAFRVHLASLAVFALSLGMAGAIQTDNHGLHAVPAPAGGVKIDGDLTDWDLSGQMLITYDLESLRDIYSAQVAGMYDAENFYLAIHWKDATPMGNSHDPRYQANRGWAGDAVQLRFKTDRISHITAWYYAAKKEPAFQITYGKSLTEPFGGGDLQLFQTEGWKLQQGVEMAFKADADGKGYVQEMKIPWGLITNGKKFLAGDRFSLGMELLWGEADLPVHRYADNLAESATSREFFWTSHPSWGPVILEAKGNLKLPEPAYMAALRTAQQGDAVQGPVEIKYALPKGGRVSLAIEDASGKRIRNLVTALPRKVGKNVERWDGLDDAGKPVAPGDYTFKGILHDGVRASYVLSFANPGNPTWETADNRGAFYGDHTAPHAAAAGGEFVALGCPLGEAGKHLIGCDLDGQKVWGLPNRTFGDGGNISLATDGKTLWVANEGTQTLIYQVDITNGKYVPWDRMDKDKDGNEFKVLDLKVSDLPGVRADKKRWENLSANHSAIAYKPGALAVCLSRENVVKILNPRTGEVASQVTVDAPRSVAFSPDGRLLILAHGKILTADSQGATAPLGQESYADAHSIATDAAGQIFVSVRGTDQNVKVLSPEGKPLREIGVRGGRPYFGKFNKDAMLEPAQIAVDSRNRLWVTEEASNPKRTSVWSTSDGKLLKDLSGTTSYAGAGSINPSDPTMGLADDTVYKLDWEKGTSEPVYSVAKRPLANDLFPPSVHNLTSRIIKKNDLLYVYTTQTGRGANDVQCTIFDGSDWRSAAHTGIVNLKDNNGENTKYQHPFFAGHDGEVYSWADENGDGLVQETELQFSKLQIDGKPAALGNYYWGHLPDTDGTITYLLSGVGKLVQFPVAGYTKAGAPRYDVSKPREIVPDQNVIRGSGGEGMVMGGSNGRVYLNQDPLVMVEKDGHVVGGYPNKHVSVHGSHTAKASRPGYLIGPSSFLGIVEVGDEKQGKAGEIFCLNGNLGENYLFTHDGLFIQTLFKDVRGIWEYPAKAVRGMPFDTATGGGESFGGNFIRTAGGKTYLTDGATDARVIEITGLDSIQRFGGKFAYSQPQFDAAQKLLATKSMESQAPKTAVVSKGTVPLDGKADQWPGLLDGSKPAMELQDSPSQRYARVQARYDDKNLYLAYRVFSPRPAMKNAGQDDRLLFKTGDAVDLMVGLESDGGASGKRLLMTIKDGHPIAVLNQKKDPSASVSEKFGFSSPSRTITFDRVVPVKGVEMVSAPLPGGYLVEAAIPWSVLGITPKSGLVLKADVGVLFGDQGGVQTIARQYWSNKATGLVNDVPGEADLAPNLWGKLTLE